MEKSKSLKNGEQNPRKYEIEPGKKFEKKPSMNNVSNINVSMYVRNQSKNDDKYIKTTLNAN